MVSSLDGYGGTAKTSQPIRADILIGDLSTNKEVGEAVSDPKTGDYKTVLTYGINYGFHAAAPGHLSVSENLELVQVRTYTEIEKDLNLLPIIVGQTIQLNNVFFEQANLYSSLNHILNSIVW